MIRKREYIFCYRKYLPLIFVFVIRFETTKKRWGWNYLFSLLTAHLDLCKHFGWNFLAILQCFKICYESFPLCYNPANIYFFKLNNRNARKRCEICLKFTIKTLERRHWCCSDVSIVDFEQVNISSGAVRKSSIVEGKPSLRFF